MARRLPGDPLEEQGLGEGPPQPALRVAVVGGAGEGQDALSSGEGPPPRLPWRAVAGAAARAIHQMGEGTAVGQQQRERRVGAGQLPQ